MNILFVLSDEEYNQLNYTLMELRTKIQYIKQQDTSPDITGIAVNSIFEIDKALALLKK